MIHHPDSTTPAIIQQFMFLYQQLNRDTLSLARLSECYHQQVHFLDPFHERKGLLALHNYFFELYQNVQAIEFDFHDVYGNDQGATVTWQMRYQHPKIQRGDWVVVDGVSVLQYQDGLIIRHQDYFDGGQMLYQHLPVLGWFIQKLKQRMVA
ncbi:MAG: nuclear transport factor 2 family protein [Bacterioplanes sp.]|nr:nuclear transport factor 2 family protein [Bacterioplanes sp.]